MQTFFFPWEDLIGWYTHHGRHSLPWRDYTHTESNLLYRVWLSEILLQQTQVERVIPYFQRILDRYPHISTLSEATYEEFFPYYQGMGYYSRARNILKTAKIIHEEYDDTFPLAKHLLLKLPGVGEYTSRAILAFGRGEPYLAWDTNLEKVFARYINGTKEQKLTEQEKERIEKDFRDFIENSLPREQMKPENGGSGMETVGDESSMAEVRGESTVGAVIKSNEKLSEATSERVGFPPETFDTFGHKSMQRSTLVRAINNALMDFASTVDLKNPLAINWDTYPIRSGKFFETGGTGEKVENTLTKTFPIPDASVIVVLHQDHKIYYSSSQDSYTPFILPPAGVRDTRKYVQEHFREQYSLELSVRPVHKKWLSKDGKPYIMVNAQIQTGLREQFAVYNKSEAKTLLESL